VDELSRRLAARGRDVPAPEKPPVDIEAVLEARGTSPEQQRGTSFAEIRRIVDLPVRGKLTPEEIEEISRIYCQEAALRRGFRLFEEQARMISEFSYLDGAFGNVPVGRGKTLIDIALAQVSYADKGHRKVLVLVPPGNVDSMVRLIPQIRRWITVTVPLHYVQGNVRARGRLAGSGLPGCYVMPYSLLSTPDTVDILNAIEPSVLICDEVHRLKNRTSARTKRITKYLRGHPGTKFVGMSGTITNKSLMDYWHLLGWALGGNAPVPMSRDLIYQLAAVLDADADPTDDAIRRWAPLRYWARAWFPDEPVTGTVEGLRRAYRLRFSSAPGVVPSSGEQLDTGLLLRNAPREDAVHSPSQAGRKQLDEMIQTVRDLYVTPSGDELAHAVQAHKWLRELTVGFYNQQVWPEPEKIARRHGVGEDDAREMIVRAQTHHDLHQEYVGALRKWLSKGQQDKLDTPRLVGQNMAAHGARDVGEGLYRYWKAMKDEEFREMPQRESRPVRVCPFKVDYAVRWALRNAALPDRGGVIWVYHRAVGEWVLEALQEAGIEGVVPAPAGNVPELEDPQHRSSIFVASIFAHNTGRNMQHHRHQLCLEWPRNAVAAQQMLGRLHRTGQDADDLVVGLCDVTDYDVEARAAGLNDALYQTQTTGEVQKVIWARYEPTPQTMPTAVLRERGFEPETLTREQEQMLSEQFDTA